eukprot:285825-Rhodomonas_salina.1
MLLCGCYGVCGTELAYVLPATNANGTACPIARYFDSIWCYAMCGTELAYGAVRCAVLRQLRGCLRVHTPYAMSGTDLAYAAAYVLRDVRTLVLRITCQDACFLRDVRICCYAMSGTDIACTMLCSYAISTRTPILTKTTVAGNRFWTRVGTHVPSAAWISQPVSPYAASGTDSLHRATVRVLAMRGTDRGYAATGCALGYAATRESASGRVRQPTLQRLWYALRYAPTLMLRHVRYRPAVGCYTPTRMTLCHVRYRPSICCHRLRYGDAMPCPVLTWRMLLCQLRCCDSVCSAVRY